MTATAGNAESASVVEGVRRLANRAMARGLRLATAESCTGGLLSKAITDLPGASACYSGGLIAYSNDIKVRPLGVDPVALERHGAVSRIVALQMAFGACRSFSADLAMSVTGIAGPGGGTQVKPVGTVWLAVALSTGTGIARQELFDGDRATVRESSVATVLHMALQISARR